MSLNNIELKTHTIAQLYSKNLVQTKHEKAPKIEPKVKAQVSRPATQSPLKYLGNNLKNILVVVNHPSLPYLPDEDLSFLSNVLAACKLSLSDIAVVNKAQVQAETLSQWISTSAERVILFAVEPPEMEMPINFPEFQTQQFNKRTYLHAPALSVIQSDKALKAKLWNALKTMFGI